jgi:multicomponent Na+:H+ antiporter subunit E
MTYIFFVLASYLFYLLFTAGSGNLWLWSAEELIVGGVVSLFLSALFMKIVPRKIPLKILNPLNWILFLLYIIGPFLLSLTLANLEVVYRVITGRFKPAIVKIDTGLKSETGTFVLANSITLTPGTFTIDMEPDTNALYIHNLSWKKSKGEPATPKDVSGPLHGWVKRIFG